jgi:MFS family permease
MIKQYKNFYGILSYAIAALFLLYEMAVQTSPSIMVQQLMNDFGIDAAIIGLISASYFITYSLMQLPVGLILDRFSVRIMLSVAIITCALGSYTFTLATSPLMLAASRLLMGLGSAFAFVSVLTIAHYWFSGRVFALLVGLAQLLAAFGAWAGEYPLKRYLLSQHDWRFGMRLLAEIGVVLGLLAILLVRHKRPPSATKPSSVKQSLKTIFSNPQTFWIALYAFCAWSPIIIFAEQWGIPFLAKRFHFTTQRAADFTGAVWLGLALLSPLLGYLSNRIQRRCNLMQLCSLFGLAAILGLLLLPSNMNSVLVFICLFGIGVAASGQILSFALVRDINPANITATAIAFNNLAVVIGGLLLHPLVGYFLRWINHQEHLQPHNYTAYDYALVFLFIPFFYLIGFFVSRFKITETHCQNTHESVN